MEEGAIVQGLGKTSWSAAMGDRQEHAIKIGTISRKIIRCRPTLNQSVLMCCMCASTGVELNTNDLMVFESASLTKMERIACRSGKMVPIRTQWNDRTRGRHQGPTRRISIFAEQYTDEKIAERVRWLGTLVIAAGTGHLRTQFLKPPSPHFDLRQFLAWAGSRDY